jgi:hypothetical protein
MAKSTWTMGCPKLLAVMMLMAACMVQTAFGGDAGRD